MPVEVKLPALGDSVSEGAVTRWLKQVGDDVAFDEPLLEVSTDKVDTEVPSPVEGTLLEIVVGEDEVVVVGTVLAIIEERSEATFPSAPEIPEALNSPKAGVLPEGLAAPTDCRTAAQSSDGTGSPSQESPLRGQRIRMSRLRSVIAERMVHSLQTSAQLTSVVEVDMTEVARLRVSVQRDFRERNGLGLSFMPFFAKAALEALKLHPEVNATIDAERKEVWYHDAEHLAIAVDTDPGLLAPVIKNAGNLSITELARAIADVAERARAGQLGNDDLAGGTFTLTNTGSRGALFDTPIINQPQVAILGTGSVVKRSVVVEDPRYGDATVVRQMAYLALTYDHRLVDGADAARYLTDVKTRLERCVMEV